MTDEGYRRLEARVGRIHLRQRLGIERDKEDQVFGQGRTFFHIENWYFVHTVIRGILRATLFYGRGQRNALSPEVRRNDLLIPGLPAAFDGYTILHLSDLHLDMHPGLPAAIAGRLAGLEYHLCVMTGDYRARTHGPIEPALEGMRHLRPHITAPVYGVLGNHDSIHMVTSLEDLGVRLLMNEAVVLERAGQRLHLAGIDDPHYFRADNIEKASHGVPHDEVSILLSHSPEMYRHAAHADFDVMLSGHTHGGQICLPGRIPLMCNARCPRRLCAGAWRYHQMQGYTSAGAGVSVVDARFNCPPEVTLHRLRTAPAAANQ